jgi:hypothetical protein
VPGIEALDLQVTPEHTLVAVQQDFKAVEIDAHGATKPLPLTPPVVLETRSSLDGFAGPLIDTAQRQDGTLFVLHGDPARISKHDGTKVADVPGARAIVFGNGGGLDPAHLYVAEKDAISLIRPD